MAEWWDKNQKIPWNDKNFQKILEFYLFNCPSETEKGKKNKGTLRYEKVSQRAKTLRQQGWTDGYLNSLFASMKHTTSGKLVYEKYKSQDNIVDKCVEIEKNSSLTDEHFEMIVFQERSDMSLTGSVFYYIRNAFAHGSFSIVGSGEKRTYYLESAKDDKVKARIRLRETTLLQWIDDFNLSPQVLKMALLEKRNIRKKQKRKGKRPAA